MAPNIFAQELITSDDRSPVVSIINWIMMCTMVLSVVARIGMKAVVSRVLNSDDFVISCAMIFSIAQSIALGVQTSNGIGKHQKSLSQANIRSYEKAAYSSDLFFIINLVLSKMSTLLLLRQITPVAIHRKLTLGTMILVASWAFTTTFASALQCATPDTWDVLGFKCFDQLVFWTFFGAMNIVTELLIIGLAIYFLWGVHIARKSKVGIMMSFVIRLSIVGAVIAQLIFLHRITASSDKTFESWPYYISTIFVQNLSVITACVPFIQNFMLGLESGMIRVDDQERRRKMSGATNLSGSNTSGAKNSDHKASVPPVSGAERSKNNGQGELELELREIDDIPLTAMRGDLDHTDNTTVISTTTGRPDDGSQASDEGRIRATTEVTIVNCAL